MFYRLSIFFLFLMFSGSAFSQFTYRLDQSIPVQVNGNPITLPWAGGFNAAQFSTMDLNGDGQQDLVIFERTANKVLTFINNAKTYVYSPEYISLFPDSLDQWVLLRDFNFDGKKDLFTHNIFGITVYVNITEPGGPLRWRLFYPQLTFLQTTGYAGEPINLQVNSTDIPVIDDIDEDGDLDILVARFDGIGSIEWHKNMSIENTGKSDSMQFVLQTLRTPTSLKRLKWGNFEECNCGEYLYGADTACLIFAGGRTEHAAGKSMLTLDVDNDGDRDLLFSEETCTDIYFFKNFGTKDSASFTGFTQFPPASPIVNLQIFPATYYEDVDFDGIPDLLASTNVYVRNSILNDFQHSAWFYKNTGTASLPQFSFIKKNFLQDQMIEVGDNATPAFIDADGDGDFDMFIGSFTSSNIVSNVFFYENTGTPNDPKFEFVTSDYATFSSLGYYNVKPQFADLNSDGTLDFAFTATDTASGVTTLYYIPNKSKIGLDINLAKIVNSGFTIAIDENVLIVDVNQDGQNDILHGTSTGALYYWKNTGQTGTLSFILQDKAYLGLGITTGRQNPVVTAGDLNADGKTDLIMGDQSGKLTVFDNFRKQDSPTGVTNIVWDSLSQTYNSPNLGGRVWPSIVNLLATNKPVIVVGNLLGGVQVLRNDGGRELPQDPVISVYPNPAFPITGYPNKTFFILADRNLAGQFFTVLGQKILNAFTVTANEAFQVTATDLASGVYIIQFSVGNKIYIRRISIP